MYLVDRKDTLPAGKLHVPPTAGRNPFRLTRYMYLAGWKETLPAL
jgi:hypothetical protein